jgi:hypothetical protein
LAEQQDAAHRAARDAAAAAAFQPPTPARARERRWVKGAAALALLVLAVLGFASYKFVANAGHAQHSASVGRSPGKARPVPARTPGVLASPATAGTASASPSAAPSPSAATSASVGPPQALAPVSVAAFGPAGTADGDNPLNAALAVSGVTTTPWYSYVYASPDFSDRPPGTGRPQGTGLLLDMGRTVTVTSVRVSLDGERGATLQLRAGDKPALSQLPQLTTVPGAAGTVQLQPGASVPARYVLIWFTQLPPDPAGTYQASVYQITVLGHQGG